MPEELTLTSAQTTMLVMRAGLKLIVIILIAFELSRIHPFATLLVLFAGYFSMPTAYYTDRPYQAVEAWFRFWLGFYIPVVIWAIFSGNVSVLLNLGTATQATFSALLSAVIFVFSFGFIKTGIFVANGGVQTAIAALVLIAFAFFPTFPERKEETALTIKMIGSKIGGAVSENSRGLGTFFFVVFMIYALLYIFSPQANLGNLFYPFLTIFMITFFMGWVGGREGRPYAGIIALGFALFAFSFSYTGTFGAAVFGQWWPVVQSTSSQFFTPLAESFSGVSQGLSDTLLLVSNPAAWWAKQQTSTQTSGGELTQGGTVKSIEFTNFEAINYGTATPNIDPLLPLIGSVELENQGDFVADSIVVTLDQPKVKDPNKIGAAYTSGALTDLANDNCVFNVCTGTTPTPDSKTCNWPASTFPGEVKLMTFKCGDSVSSSPYKQWAIPSITSHDTQVDYEQRTIDDASINQCHCVTSDNKWTSSSCVSSSMCPLDPSDPTGQSRQSKVYTLGGWSTVIGFKYTFGYDVNVSLPVDVMNLTVFVRKLAAKEITVQSKESQFSGGPLKAVIFVQKQPLRGGEESFGRISIVNTGQGTAKSATLTMFIPKNITGIPLSNGPSEISKSGLMNCATSDITLGNILYTKLACDLASDLKPDAAATYTFNFQYDLDNSLETKSVLFIGDIKYTYETLKTLEMPILQGPLSQ